MPEGVKAVARPEVYEHNVTHRRTFLAWVGSLPFLGRARAAGTVVIDAAPTALYQQPDGRNNLVRIAATGLDAPAARARITDRRGALVGTAGLLPAADGAGGGGGGALAGEVWLPLTRAAEFQIELEVAKRRVATRRIRLAPPRRWTLYWIASSHTDVGRTDLAERCLEVHRKNLDDALAWLPAHPEFRWTAECALQVISYVEHRAPSAAQALSQALRDGKTGLSGLFAHLLTGLLDHETFARAAWPAGLFAREQGLGYLAAQIADVPGQVATFPTLLAASGVRYLASGVNPERAAPLMSSAAAARAQLTGEWTTYPQLYWWQGPDGSRVLHWRSDGYADAPRFGFDVGPEEMARRLSDWLLTHPVFVSPAYPYDVALLVGAAGDNGRADEGVVANVEDFNRRYAFPRLIAARPEDFFRDVEQRWGTKVPVRRGDTGCYREDGAASAAAELARFRAAQLTARAAELLTLWDEKTEPRSGAAARIERRTADRRRMWRQLLLFAEHTWGSSASVSDPDGPDTLAQWAEKHRLLERAADTAAAQVAGALLRLGLSTGPGAGRMVFNASSWTRSDIVRVPGGAGRRLTHGGRDWPAVDMPDGSALTLARDVPALGYLSVTERERPLNPPTADGTALEAQAGSLHVVLDPTSGGIRSLTMGDGKERVRPGTWPGGGLNQLVYVRGGARSALWTGPAKDELRTPPDLSISQAELASVRRERLPGIGARLVVERALSGVGSLTSIVTLYEELPWLDIENRIAKPATLEKEALYVAFPFALSNPTVDVEVPLGRMTVEKDQQPGSCRDWYSHLHWVWLHDTADGILWSGPDTPLVTLNDIFRGQWRRTIAPDGTLFAYVLHNYWYTNFPARQGGELSFRFRISALAPGSDAAEPMRRGWAACDPLYVSAPYTSAAERPLASRDSALFVPDNGVAVVGAKTADDGAGVIVKLVDVSGIARPVSVWPGTYRFRQARRVNFVEMNGDAIAVAPDGRVTIDLPAWGTAALRLFTSPEGAG